MMFSKSSPTQGGNSETRSVSRLTFSDPRRQVEPIITFPDSPPNPNDASSLQVYVESTMQNEPLDLTIPRSLSCFESSSTLTKPKQGESNNSMPLSLASSRNALRMPWIIPDPMPMQAGSNIPTRDSKVNSRIPSPIIFYPHSTSEQHSIQNTQQSSVMPVAKGKYSGTHNMTISTSVILPKDPTISPTKNLIPWKSSQPKMIVESNYSQPSYSSGRFEGKKTSQHQKTSTVAETNTNVPLFANSRQANVGSDSSNNDHARLPNRISSNTNREQNDIKRLIIRPNNIKSNFEVYFQCGTHKSRISLSQEQEKCIEFNFSRLQNSLGERDQNPNYYVERLVGHSISKCREDLQRLLGKGIEGNLGYPAEIAREIQNSFNKLGYLLLFDVKWKGYPWEQITHEPASNIDISEDGKGNGSLQLNLYQDFLIEFFNLRYVSKKTGKKEKITDKFIEIVKPVFAGNEDKFRAAFFK